MDRSAIRGVLQNLEVLLTAHPNDVFASTCSAYDDDGQPNLEQVVVSSEKRKPSEI